MCLNMPLFYHFSFHNISVPYTSYVGFAELTWAVGGRPRLNPVFKLTKRFTTFKIIREHWVPDFRTKGPQWLFPLENRVNLWTNKSITWPSSIFITFVGKKFLHKWWTQVMLNLEHFNCYTWWIFLWWKVSEPSFFSKSSNEEV